MRKLSTCYWLWLRVVRRRLRGAFGCGSTLAESASCDSPQADIASGDSPQAESTAPAPLAAKSWLSVVSETAGTFRLRCRSGTIQHCPRTACRTVYVVQHTTFLLESDLMRCTHGHPRAQHRHRSSPSAIRNRRKDGRSFLGRKFLGRQRR